MEHDASHDMTSIAYIRKYQIQSDRLIEDRLMPCVHMCNDLTSIIILLKKSQLRHTIPS